MLKGKEIIESGAGGGAMMNVGEGGSDGWLMAGGERGASAFKQRTRLWSPLVPHGQEVLVPSRARHHVAI